MLTNYRNFVATKKVVKKLKFMYVVLVIFVHMKHGW